MINRAHLEANTRSMVVAQGFLEKNRNTPIADHLASYAAAAEEDLRGLTEYVLPFFFIREDIPKRFFFRVDKNNLQIEACVYRQRRQIVVEVSLGTMLAIDDASAMIARWTHPDSAVLYDKIEELQNIEPRFEDYSFLTDTNLKPGGPRNFVYCNPVLFFDDAMMKYRGLLANMCLLWAVLHEIGHVKLGHEQDRKLGIRIDPVTNTNSWTAQEFAADVYATHKFFSTFYRADAIEHALPKTLKSSSEVLYFLTCASALTSLILHRSTLSVTTNEQRESSNYPDANVRLFNVLACITPGIDNNSIHLSPFLKALGIEDVTLPLRLEEHIQSTSITMSVFDKFLDYINAVPLLHWKLAVEEKLLPDGVQVKLTRKFDEMDVVRRSHAEIAAAAICAARNPSEHCVGTRVSSLITQWYECVSAGSLFWKEQTPQDAKELVRQIGENDDFHVPLTLCYLGEIVNAANAIEGRDFAELVNQIEETLSTCENLYGPWSEHPLHSNFKPRETDALSQGCEFINEGRFLESIAKFNECIEKEEEVGHAFYMRGYAYGKLGESKLALADITRAIESGVVNDKIFGMHGYLLVEFQQYEMALASYNKHLSANPEDQEVLYNRGATHASLNRHEDAACDYSKVLQFNPDNQGALNNRGFAYFNLEKYDLAINDFDAALSLNPDDIKARVNRADALRKNLQFKEAAEEYWRIWPINPGLDILYLHAVSRTEGDDFENAVAALDHANKEFQGLVRRTPRSDLKNVDTIFSRKLTGWELGLALGCIHFCLQNYDKSIAHLSEARKFNPSNDAISYMANLAQDAKNDSEEKA